jgi:2-oxo-4-hydroxy-4-carboxy-5-ureidoimidazoline decarboxylase
MSPAASPMPMARLARLDRQDFVAALDGVFEHSLWVAAASWERRPFADLDALHRAMVAVVAAAGPERQLALICAHPELAGAAALRGDIAAPSRAEQSAAGLSALGAEDLARFRDLNERYRRKFGFPFVIAVAGRSRAEILARFAARLDHAPATEVAAALEEIARIARLRLEQRLSP